MDIGAEVDELADIVEISGEAESEVSMLSDDAAPELEPRDAVLLCRRMYVCEPITIVSEGEDSVDDGYCSVAWAIEVVAAVDERSEPAANIPNTLVVDIPATSDCVEATAADDD